MTTQKTPYAAPGFKLNDSNGIAHDLKDFAGGWLVLYFYPMDDTPGCTIEACSFRDSHDALLAKKATVVGISRDDGDSHNAFKNKYELPFLLLSDPDHSVMDAYGAYGLKMFGKEGVLRKTFIINPEGQIVKVYGRVTPLGHAEAVLSDLEQLQK